MSPLIKWKDDWLLGIDSLDNQHKAMADCINRLVAVCEQSDRPENRGAQKENIKQLIEDLYATMKTHFSFEEALMRHESYPSYAAHAREHVMLVAELKATFAEHLHESGCNLNAKVLGALKSWLIAHISHSDRDFANFVHNKPVK